VRIFLVGKMFTGWRHSLVKGLAEFTKTLDPAKDGWPIMEGAIFGIHDFTGPYEAVIPKGTPEAIKTHRLCLQGIDNSDLVYCWFDDIEAHASLFEMGYAKARDRFTVTTYPRGFDRREFWFLSCCSDEFMEADTPAAGLIMAMMKIVKSGRIKNPEVELERVERNLKRLEEINANSNRGNTTEPGGGS
jgi:hypothetical protein